MKNREAEDTRPVGTIGDISARIGYDVRELIIDGYSWQQIYEVANRRLTLVELFKHKPENEPIDTKEVLRRLGKRRHGTHTPSRKGA